MPWKLAACACLIVALSVACQPDSPSITEVQGTLDHHPERPSCHFAPEAIKTVEGEDEVVLIEFTYGGGATWGGVGGDCGEDPGPNLGGVLLAADGVSYGDTVGADGYRNSRLECARTSRTRWRLGIPSGISLSPIQSAHRMGHTWGETSIAIRRAGKSSASVRDGDEGVARKVHS